MEENWAAYLEALASADQPKTAFESLARIVADKVGVRLFTVMLHDFDAGRARRVYSSRDDVYPAGGWKPINEDNRFADEVLRRRQPLVNHSYEDLREVFPDHETIRSLGCEASCHVPVIVEDSILGVLNMLNVSRHFTQERVDQALALRPFAVGPMFLARKRMGLW